MGTQIPKTIVVRTTSIMPGGSNTTRTSYRSGSKGNNKGRGGNKAFKGYNKKKTKNETSRSTKKKTLDDFQYYVGSAKQSSDFVKNTKFVISHIKTTLNYGEDIANALENCAHIDVDALYAPSLIAAPTLLTDKPGAFDERGVPIAYNQNKIDVIAKQNAIR